jgi:RNA polymerase-binding transcription factor DksA
MKRGPRGHEVHDVEEPIQRGEDKARAHEFEKLAEETGMEQAVQGPHRKYLGYLLELRDRLLDDIAFHAGDHLHRTEREASGDLSAYKFHMADAGTDNFDREFSLSMVSNSQETLDEINAAIRRIEIGSYGTCELCGETIRKERLDAIPWARFDVKCQEQYEKKHPRRRSVTDFTLEKDFDVDVEDEREGRALDEAESPKAERERQQLDDLDEHIPKQTRKSLEE